MKAHAILSPSAAHRWLHCTASPLLEAVEPDRETAYAAEGTLAHALCAKAVKEAIGMDTGEEETEIDTLAAQGLAPDAEMEAHAESYRDIVMELLAAAKESDPLAFAAVEVRLDLTEWMPEAFGTADCVVVGGNTLEVIDFKYGKGVEVSAQGNPQMMIYALGALDVYDMVYDIETVRMAIVQPRLGNYSTWEIAASELRRWGAETLRAKAAEALAGGEQHAGDWCRFCKVRSHCRVIAVNAMGLAESDPRLMTPEEIAAEVLPRLAMVEAWVGCVKEHTLAQALAGTAYPGYKLVEGRSVRRITDTAGAAGALRVAGYADIYKPQELRSITELEKLVGKKRFGELCGAYVTKPEGKPTLVPESDKREALDRGGMFDDINV